MQIDGNHPAGMLMSTSRLSALREGQKMARSGKQPTPTPPAESKSATETQPATDENQTRGVIRLLEAGHFKGVADVRLRINFLDELSAKAAAAGTQIASAGTGELIANVTDQARQAVGNWALDEETQAVADEAMIQFENESRAALEDATSGGSVNSTTLAEGLKAAFEAFAGQLESLAAPAEPDPGLPEEIEDAPADAETPQPDLSDDASRTDIGLESLTRFFDEQLMNLLASIEEGLQLPPLAPEPTGNGKAYAKFLAMYNELTGQTSSEPPAENEEPIDLLI